MAGLSCGKNQPAGKGNVLLPDQLDAVDQVDEQSHVLVRASNRTVPLVGYSRQNHNAKALRLCGGASRLLARANHRT